MLIFGIVGTLRRGAGIVIGFKCNLQNGARLLRGRIECERSVCVSLKHRPTKGYPSSVGICVFGGIKKRKKGVVVVTC